MAAKSKAHLDRWNSSDVASFSQSAAARSTGRRRHSAGAAARAEGAAVPRLEQCLAKAVDLRPFDRLGETTLAVRGDAMQTGPSGRADLALPAAPDIAKLGRQLHPEKPASADKFRKLLDSCLDPAKTGV